jgi:hypothetical protein
MTPGPRDGRSTLHYQLTVFEAVKAQFPKEGLYPRRDPSIASGKSLCDFAELDWVPLGIDGQRMVLVDCNEFQFLACEDVAQQVHNPFANQVISQIGS